MYNATPTGAPPAPWLVPPPPFPQPPPWFQHGGGGGGGKGRGGGGGKGRGGGGGGKGRGGGGGGGKGRGRGGGGGGGDDGQGFYRPSFVENPWASMLPDDPLGPLAPLAGALYHPNPAVRGLAASLVRAVDALPAAKSCVTGLNGFLLAGLQMQPQRGFA